MIFKIGLSRVFQSSAFKGSPLLNYQTCRTTFVFKRRAKDQYTKQDPRSPYIVGPFLKEYNPEYALRENTDYVYDMLDTTEKNIAEDVEVILTKHVRNLGLAGDIVKVRPTTAQFRLIVNKQAVYATEINKKLYQHLIGARENTIGPSSRLSMATVAQLERITLTVLMGRDEPWTLEKWHVRVAFRKAKYEIPEHAIELPFTPITGPDVDGKENKDFAIIVTVNKREKVNVRCGLHHYGSPENPNWYKLPNRKVILPEQKELLDSMFKNEPIDETEESHLYNKLSK